MRKMEYLTTEKASDEFTEEQVRLLAACVAYSFIKALKKVRNNKDGNSSGRSNESDDES